MRKIQIKSPAEKLVENQIDIAEATLDAESNGLVQALNMGGGLMQQIGSSMMSKGVAKGNTGFVADNANNIEALMGLLSGANKLFAYGGRIPTSHVEVEGGEVAETPSGNNIKFKGPKHEKGGIKTNLPPGTNIFSDRVEIEGKTMAERKKDRDRKEKKSSGEDTIDKNSLKRIKAANEIEEEEDMYIQEVINFLSEQNKNIQTFATGGKVKPRAPRLLPQENVLKSSFKSNLNSFLDPNAITESENLVRENFTKPIDTTTEDGGFNILSSLPTIGDSLGMAGNIFQAVSAYKNTLANRAGDTPNINAFENFGLDALETNARAMSSVGALRDKQLTDLDRERSTAVSRNRQGARSINTMRALDIASTMAANKGESDIQANYINQLLSLMGQESQLENMRDNAVMSGEAQKDIADRQDRDNFYTNKGANLTDIGKVTSQTGKILNDMKARDTQSELLQQLFDYVGFDPYTGTIKGKKVNLNTKTKK